MAGRIVVETDDDTSSVTVVYRLRFAIGFVESESGGRLRARPGVARERFFDFRAQARSR